MRFATVGLLLAVVGCVPVVSVSGAETVAAPKVHWNQFRGPQGDGISTARNLPVEFSETKNVRWKVPVLGVGWSSPVVWKNQVWVTSGIEGGRKLLAICLDVETGKIVHQVTVFDVTNPGMEWTNQNPHATPTPLVEEGRIYVHYGSYGTACLDTASGKVLWKRQDLKCNHRVGPASSPIADDQSLFLQLDGVDVQYVVALDKLTGKTRWQTTRQVTSDLATRLRNAGLSEEAIRGTLNKKPGDNRKSYATPTLVTVEGKQQLIAPGAEVLFSYDPQTGKEIWRVDLQGWCWNVACRPILANGLIYVTTGIAKELMAIRPGGRGNVTESHVSWTRRQSVPNMSSPLLVGSRLYMVTDSGGIVTCMDARSGEQVWRNRLRPSGDHWASPVLANGKIYFCSKTGDVTVIEAGESYQGIASNRLEANLIASPAVAGDSLILRSTTHLYCLAKGYERTAEQVAAERREAETKMLVSEAAGKGRGVQSPRVKALLEAGTITREQSQRLDAFAIRLREMVQAGKLTRKEATDLWQSLLDDQDAKQGEKKGS
ncbi:MAG: PQQ-binding-like beta-propeller repeat protein [Planctomycetaceae bacterium]|nr:PQQ-binding-like beta-propeller repeat protein [Planctomycetaceae bacterium]